MHELPAAHAASFFPFPSSSQGIVFFSLGKEMKKFDVRDANFFLSLMRFDQTNTFVKGSKDNDKVQPIAPLTPSYKLIDISSYFSALEQETRKKISGYRVTVKLS